MQPDVLATTCCDATDIHKRGLGEGMHDNSLDRIGEITGELEGFPLRVPNEGLRRPRVARAQKIISLHPLLAST
jgi:hypothetical protein